MDDETMQTIRNALRAADRLTTAVVANERDQVRLALDVARALDTIKKKRLFTY